MKQVLSALALTCLLGSSSFAGESSRNVLLFVADGLRPEMVSEQNTPALARLLREGVRFTNTHSIFPTFTTANASAIATGHKLGDTGDFSNTIYTGFPVPGAGGSFTPFLESDPVLGDVDEHFAGDYLNQETVMRAARLVGMSTATIGKLGPALILDHTERSGDGTIVVDDMTGRAGGIPLNKEIEARLDVLGLASQAPTRGDNGKAGDFRKPGTTSANTVQQGYFLDVTTKAVLPLFKEPTKPFMLVYWSRDPDGTQHNQGDSLGRLVPGINGQTSLAAIRNADHDLAELRASLEQLGLEGTTDIIVTADHGFSTISKESATSLAAGQSYDDTPAGLLPSGFLALDLTHGLELPILDPDAGYTAIGANRHPVRGNGLIGGDKDHPKLIMAANGGSDLVYLPDGDAGLVRKVIEILAHQDYVSGLFVSDEFGEIPGTLPISSIDLKGSAVTPIPAIVVNLRSFSTGCDDPTTCAVEVADAGLQQGQGMHGGFSRADTAILGGALGPSFRKGFVDPAPTSNADIGMTMASLLGLSVKDTGTLVGRILTEAMIDGAMPRWERHVQVSEPGPEGRRTAVAIQTVGSTRYFDAAGFPGRTLGLDLNGWPGFDADKLSGQQSETGKAGK